MPQTDVPTPIVRSRKPARPNWKLSTQDAIIRWRMITVVQIALTDKHAVSPCVSSFHRSPDRSRTRRFVDAETAMHHAPVRALRARRFSQLSDWSNSQIASYSSTSIPVRCGTAGLCLDAPCHSENEMPAESRHHYSNRLRLYF